MPTLANIVSTLVSEAACATKNSPNEATLRHRLENVLERSCTALSVAWLPCPLDRTVRPRTGQAQYIDVAHGGVLIEYEPPCSLRRGSVLSHARQQVEEYAILLEQEEGRALQDYRLIVWDGDSMAEGRYEADGRTTTWTRLQRFGASQALRLMQLLQSGSRPLVHPRLLNWYVGPDSEIGASLIPRLFDAAAGARSGKTLVLYLEWRRLFGQIVGSQSEQLRALLEQQGRAHHRHYESSPSAYLFALNTYIAIVAKVVAALSLPGASENVGDPSVPIRNRMQQLESGTLFTAAGILNMLSGDFFSWYVDDVSWEKVESEVDLLVSILAQADYETPRRSSAATRDLFKEMYQTFTPRGLRHALGEYYTPDWLAEHVFTVAEWRPTMSMLDPTCGSGTFVLEAIKRRLAAPEYQHATAKQILSGVYGVDLNPFAVLIARASLVVCLADRLNPSSPVTLPIFLADAMNLAKQQDDEYLHSLQTEKGLVTVGVPTTLVADTQFYEFFDRTRGLIDAGLDAGAISASLEGSFPGLVSSDREHAVLLETFETLVRLHKLGWDSIWCSVLANRFAAAGVPQVDLVVGNPPWVKWSNLPPEYAQFIKPHCIALGVFSEDSWVGGIESDISTVVTYDAITQWLRPGGRLAFLITGTVLSNKSSSGFRKFRHEASGWTCRVISVEDFADIRPFEGVSNSPVLLLLEKNGETSYPIPYSVWHWRHQRPNPSVHLPSSDEEFASVARREELVATPLRREAGQAWLKGSPEQVESWLRLFVGNGSTYTARKGITTDCNGIFFVKIVGRANSAGIIAIENDPDQGRTRGLPSIRTSIEGWCVFPLLRGHGVSAFHAVTDADHVVLLPQTGMSGDPDLPSSAPLTFAYLGRFRAVLQSRSSYRRFQSDSPWWSIWSTGPYTFSPYKVVWRELSGGGFAAAYVKPMNSGPFRGKPIVPDHKVYFVPCETEDEAAYLTGVLNSPLVRDGINAYASALSLGTAVTSFLEIPVFTRSIALHRKIARFSVGLASQVEPPSEVQLATLDSYARQLLVPTSTAMPGRA